MNRKELLKQVEIFQAGGVPLELLVSFLDSVAGASPPTTPSAKSTSYFCVACWCFWVEQMKRALCFVSTTCICIAALHG